MLGRWGVGGMRLLLLEGEYRRGLEGLDGGVTMLTALSVFSGLHESD